MNKIYRLKFDRRRNELVVVSEIVAGTGKKKNTGHIADLCDVSTFRKLVGTLTPLAFLTGLIISLFPVVALANPDLPTGGQIVGGQGSISTSGNQMTIHQQTQNMATNWQRFDIGKNNTVQFVQPDSSSVALNRVTGASGSQIMGTLKANGQVFILNPNGVLFGKDARVNVAGLVASTKNINTADFMKGQYTLSGESNPGAQVINQGSLTTTKGGYIVLAADQVKNSGTITTPSGKTVLAAGKTVTLQLDNGGLTSVSVDGSVVNALVDNRGLISAADGRVFLTAQGKDMLLNTVVNNSGTIEAKGLESRGGEIVLNGGDSGVVNQTGQLLADSHAGPGGKITVEGQNIHLAANSRTSATGKTGGGEVYVGGGWQGKDSHIRNASKMVMDKAATVDVSATDAGNGGTAVLWSDDYTNFRGAILAKGGSRSGNGGRVETSSHKNLQAFGDVDTSASAGHGGEWLLDPLDVTIVSGDANTGVTESGKGAGGATPDTDTDHVFSPSASGAQVSAQKISDQLNNGTNVTVDTHGDGGQAGNITFDKEASIKKTAGGDATLTLKADKDITFENREANARNDTDKGVINSTAGKLNLNLLTGNSGQDGATKFGDYVRLYLNGGDVFIGPANASAGSASVSFANDGTINAGNITLDVTRGLGGYAYGLQADNDLTINGPVSGTTGYGIALSFIAGGMLTMKSPGSITLTAMDTSNKGGSVVISGGKGVDVKTDNGNIELSAAAAKTNSVSVFSDNGAVSVEAGKALTVKQANISGTDVKLAGAAPDSGTGLSIGDTKINATTSLSMTGKDDNGGNTGMNIRNLTANSDGKTDITGTSYWGNAVVINGLQLTSMGDVDISGQAPGRAWALGLDINNSNISSTQGDVTLTGLSNSDPGNVSAGNGLNVKNTNITVNDATGRIVLSGSSSDKTGLWVNNSNLSGSSLSALGVSKNTGLGFAFNGSHLLGGLSDLTNVSLSSAGSAAGVTNTLDSILNDANRDTLLAMRIENMTTLEMDGKAIFDDSAKTDKGWAQDYGLADLPNHGWIFNNTSVTAGGDVNLKGVGFSNAAVTVNNGSLTLDNSGPVPLTGTTLTVNDGAVSVHAGAGNIDLKNGNISAKGDVTLKADAGSIVISGTNATVKASIISAQGNISAEAYNPLTGKVTGVSVTNAQLSAEQGNININGTTPGTWSGVRFSNADLKANADTGSIAVYGESKGGQDTNDERGSVYFGGLDAFVAKRIDITGLNLANGYNGTGLIFDGSTILFNGITSVAGYGYGVGLAFWNEVHLNFTGGDAYLKGQTTGAGGSDSYYRHGAIVGAGIYQPAKVYVNLTHSNLKVDADSSSSTFGAVPAFGIVNQGTEDYKVNGFIFLGDGDVNISGISTDGNAVDARLFDNTDLSGNVVVTGKSKSGTGVYLGGKLNATLLNALVTGISESGNGVVFEAKSGFTNLGNNTIYGTSETGSGIRMRGNNITLTGGTLTGSATSGNGSGVVLTGGSNYTLDGVSVAGASTDGSGVSVDGALTVNNGTAVEGHATGVGIGVVVSGDLATNSGNSVSLVGTGNVGDGIRVYGNASLNNATMNGAATTGNGVLVDGDTKLNNSMVSGIATDGNGSGIKISGSLFNANTTLTGNSTGKGAGVNIGGNVTGGTISGESAAGSGVVLADSADIRQAVLKGISSAGNGVTVTGKVILDDTTAKTLKADSDSGSGLTLSEGADMHIVQDGTTTPVIDAVVLSGISGTGSAVTVDGNAAISGVILKGETTAENGTGVTVKNGKLTLSDNLSGVEASATGNGTALVLENAGVDAKGYRESEGENEAKDYQLNATTTGGGVTVSTTGDNTLTSVVLSGTASGKGPAMVVNGTLSTDRDITATARSGTGLVLDGGTLSSSTTDNSPVTVTASTTGQGTAVQVAGNADSALHNVVLNGSADTGTTLDVTGNLTSDINITVSTGNGTAISLDGGSIQSADNMVPVTVNASATGENGTAVHVGSGSMGSLSDIILNTTSTQGDALKVEGTLATQNTTVHTSTTGTGTALNVTGGTLSSSGNTVVNATSDTGHAAVVSHGTLAGVSSGDLTVNAITDSVAPALTMSGDSEVTNSLVSGENNGTGTAVDISGILSSDGGGTVSGQTNGGTAVTVENGATVSGLAITGHATTGTGLRVSGTATANHATLSGQTKTGTGTALAGSLTADGDSRVNGVATENGGTGISLSGDVLGGQFSGSSTTGEGVSITGSVTNSVVSGEATQGAGVMVNNGSQVTDTIISGSAKSGTGTHWGNQVEHNNVTIQGSSSSGSGVYLEDNTTLNNATVSGDTADGKGVGIAGNLTSAGSTTVSGSSTGSGSGVELAGNVTGGSLSGNASGSGAGVTVSGPDSTATDTAISGTTADGKGVAITGNLTSAGSTTVSGSSTGSGSGVELAGNVTGGSLSGNASGSGAGVTVSGPDSTATDTAISGTTADGKGVAITGNLTSAGSTTVSGSSTGSGSGVELAGNVTGGSLSGNASGSGAGVTVSGPDSTATDTAISGTTADGKGVAITGNLSSVGTTTVSGQATVAGIGVHLNGSVSGGHLSGQSVSGDGIRLADGARVTDSLLSGNSLNGAGIHVQDNVSAEDSTLNGTSVNGSDMVVSGSLHDRNTVINAQTVTGRENISSTVPDRIWEPGVTTVMQRQGAVNAQVSRMNQPVQDGFHSAAMASVPVRGWVPSERKVNISVCDGDSCQSVSLDAGKPAESSVRLSGQ
ncbi:filamentous hemagglutinin N-terminal domain-containing protein [Salmonella enterica]|nr:filamentous hemagglutinin N-terminal domain-containing protein [Salmonella enterica]